MKGLSSGFEHARAHGLSSLRPIPGGFTLIELMIVLVVLAVLVSVAIPTFRDATLASRLNASANNMISSIHLARSEAIKRNAVMKICASTNSTSCTAGAAMEAGWIVMPAAAGAVPVLVQQAVSGGIRLIAKSGTTSISEIQFQPTGLGVTPTTVSILVCRATPSAGSQERLISVSATGKPSVKRTETGSCS